MATGGRASISLSSEQFYDFPCSVCAKDEKNTEGDKFCVECNETFCISCLVFHNKIAAMRQHELLDKTKMATRKPLQDVLQLSTSKCTLHLDQVINMYCGQHDLVCCTVCIAESHRNCEGVIYIPMKAKNIKNSQEFLDVNAAVKDMRAHITVLKEGKKLDLDRITAQHAQIQASFGKLRDQINKHLDDLETMAKKELDRKFKIQEDEINKEFAKLEEQMLKLEETANKLKDGKNESQLFVDMKEAKMKENERRKLIVDVELSVGKPALHFKADTTMLEIKTLGTLEDQKSFSSVSHYGDFDVNTSDDNETCDITGVCQMINGNIAITDKQNENIKLIDRTYKVIAKCKLPGRPMSICRTSPTEVAIALARNKMVLFAEITDKISLKRSFSVGDKCRGLAYNEGLVYVSCGGNKKANDYGPGQVRVYDMAGKLLQTFMKDKHIVKKKLFYLPSYIVVSECKTKLHITDTDNGIVTMKLNGTEPWKFTNPNMKDPTAICVVNNDDLIVCGSDSHNVIMFDKNGKQKAILLKKEDGINDPWSVFYDRPNSRLIVSMWNLNHIKVYTLL